MKSLLGCLISELVDHNYCMVSRLLVHAIIIFVFLCVKSVYLIGILDASGAILFKEIAIVLSMVDTNETIP